MNRNVYFPDPTGERDEYGEIAQAAEAAGESLSEYLRKSAFQRMQRENKPKRVRSRKTSAAE